MAGNTFTVYVNVLPAPVQLFANGVTVTVAVTADVPELLAVKAAIFPEPLAANPMLVVLFVHPYVVPLTLLLNVTNVVEAPVHTVWLLGCVTSGVGFTV